MRREFEAPIEDAGGGGAYVTVPFDVVSVFGAKRVPVKATIDGEPYRGTLVRMGGPQHMLLVLKNIRQKIGKTAGDIVAVTIERDDEERTVEIPADVRAALAANPPAGAFFDRLSYTHRREYVSWVEEAKREETRRSRIENMVRMLLDEKKPR